jgi:hypothetical protein
MGILAVLAQELGGDVSSLANATVHDDLAVGNFV